LGVGKQKTGFQIKRTARLGKAIKFALLNALIQFPADLYCLCGGSP
jgi:hypothetical protein